MQLPKAVPTVSYGYPKSSASFLSVLPATSGRNRCLKPRDAVRYLLSTLGACLMCFLVLFGDTKGVSFTSVAPQIVKLDFYIRAL